MKVSVSLCLAIYFIHQAKGKSLEDFMSRRDVRDVSDPPPVDCKMSPWSSWTPCDPCTNTTHRSRGIETFGQFKGIRCIRPIGDKKLCKPSSRCDVDPPPVCKANQWRCESEICINKNLKCNGDYDCGQPDTSDEDDCEVIRSPCGHTAAFESDLAIQAGYGINILGSGPRMNPFNNRLYKGQCGRIREPTTLEYNRLPWNVGVLNYETKVEESSSKEMYEDIHSLIREITTESSFSLDVSLNFKFTPTEASSADSASAAGAEAGSDAASPGRASDAAGAEAGSDAASPGRGSDAAGADAGSDAESPGTGSDAAGADAGSDAAGADAESDAASPGRGSDAVTLGFSASAGIGATTETTNIIKQLSEYTTTKRKSFMRVKGKLQLATYRMRQRGLEVSQTFLDSVDALPLEYEKGQYFGFIEDYGTHFTKNGKVGGEYELVYIMNEDIRQTKEITEKTLKQCFEFRAEAGFQFAKVVEGGGHVKPKTCKELTTKPTDEDTKRGVVDKVLISVRGGSPGSAVAMKSQLTKDGVIDYTQYVAWANTITALPALIHSDPEPIYNAIPLDFPDAQPRRDNLRKALKDYVSEYSVCKCLPCQNGGTVMQIDGECKCMCSPGTEGVACQIIDREIVKDKSFEQIGNWGCWGPWSECSGGRQTRTRSCNTQHLSNAKCKGDTTSEDYC